MSGNVLGARDTAVNKAVQKQTRNKPALLGFSCLSWGMPTVQSIKGMLEKMKEKEEGRKNQTVTFHVVSEASLRWNLSKRLQKLSE